MWALHSAPGRAWAGVPAAPPHILPGAGKLYGVPIFPNLITNQTRLAEGEMSFRSSGVVQGARRAPLTSKQGGVGFYKGTDALSCRLFSSLSSFRMALIVLLLLLFLHPGTGSHPALGPKSQGAHGTGRVHGRIYRLQPRKMRSFIVPQVLHDFRELCARPDVSSLTVIQSPSPSFPKKKKSMLHENGS
jgi:hypothetical protein